MDSDVRNVFDIDAQQEVFNPYYAKEGMVERADPLALDIDDDILAKTADDRIQQSKTFWNSKYNLTARRRKNEMYLFGRQMDPENLTRAYKAYETKYLHNVLYQIEGSLKPLAMSHLPDMIVLPGSDDPEQKQSAKDLSTVVNQANKSIEQRKALAIAFKHLPVYFTAILKAVWNPQLGKDGDFEFVVIPPEYVVIDHTASSPDPDKMSMVPEIQPTTVQEVIMRFPKAKDKFLAEVIKDGIDIQPGNEPNRKQLASEIKIWEIWFTWYQRKDTGEVSNQEPVPTMLEPGVKWERVEGVMWKYHDIILDKMRNPNFDYQGETRYFSYQDQSDENSKIEVSAKELAIASMLGVPMDNVFPDKVYHNYFQMPKKPYFFFGYDQWGKVAIDETSRIEQNIRNQENLDAQGKQLIDTLKTRVKHIWSKDGGLRSADVQKMDMDDPRNDALVEGNPNLVHAEVRPERPDAAQFNAMGGAVSDMLTLAGAAALQGTLQSDVATSNQIAREADFTRADDLVEDTINTACQWMAEWQMQFIKLRYTADHMRRILGDKGVATFIRIRRDMISDGMEVTIKASSTDKLKAQKNAMEAAKLGPPYSDALSFFEDMDMSDPKGRAERGFLMVNDPPGYYTKFILDLPDANAQVNQLLGQGAAQTLSGGQPTVPPTGAPFAVPQPPATQPSPMQTSNVPMSPQVGVQASPMG